MELSEFGKIVSTLSTGELSNLLIKKGELAGLVSW